ncbi:MAG: hypothetical protein UY96_C0029G0002 [Parcubacteria group bacterium GW2011_GWB1_56_8]|nr:MAG: hypothetical protein UY96_C0029G0002 [Parcubacteria group bacterium GW2011_GWB1_56_8]
MPNVDIQTAIGSNVEQAGKGYRVRDLPSWLRIYGARSPKFAKAVADYQAAMGISVTGVLDCVTLKRLYLQPLQVIPQPLPATPSPLDNGRYFVEGHPYCRSENYERIWEPAPISPQQGVTPLRIGWIAWTSEMETDLWYLPRLAQDIDVRIFDVAHKEAQNSSAHVWTRGGERSEQSIADVLEQAAAWGADLYIFRWPFWLSGVARKAFESLFRNHKVIAWPSEQGPTLLQGIQGCHGFKHIAVNARVETAAYEKAFPESTIHYMPFGCLPLRDEDLVPDKRFGSDLVSDGRCHFACCAESERDAPLNKWSCLRAYGPLKADCIHMMLDPLLDLDINFWGSDEEDHGWPGYTAGRHKYRGHFACGDYPAVYSACKVYVGISWNWRHGGYGMKLARPLSCGIPVVWPRTFGMYMDGFVDGANVLASSSAFETRAIVERLLCDVEYRQKIGQAGREYALRELAWNRQFYRLMAEV